MLRNFFRDLFFGAAPTETEGPAAPVRQPQEPKGNGLLLATTGLRVVHLRGLNGRDMTVAYRPRRSTEHNLEIATAVRNPIDVFSRKIGTLHAINNFMAGERITVPGIAGMSDVQTIKVMFELPQRAASLWRLGA